RSELCDPGIQAAVAFEQLLGAIAPEPLVQKLQVIGTVPRVGNRDLVSMKTSFDRYAIDHFVAGPALGRTQHNHGPMWPDGLACAARGTLDGAYLADDLVECGRHELVHALRIVTLDKVRRP